MSKTTKLKIVTPLAQSFSDEVYSVQLKTNEGRVTFLPDHNELAAPVLNHVAYIKKEPNGQPRSLIVLEGFVYVEKHQVRIFSDYFKFLDELNLDEVKEEMRILEEKIAIETEDKKIMQYKAQLQLDQSILKAYKER